MLSCGSVAITQLTNSGSIVLQRQGTLIGQWRVTLQLVRGFDLTVAVKRSLSRLRSPLFSENRLSAFEFNDESDHRHDTHDRRGEAEHHE